MKLPSLALVLLAACAGLALPAPAPSEALNDLLPDVALAKRETAFEVVGASGDERYLAPLVDLLRFADTAEEWFRILDAAGAITGEDLRSIDRPWNTLTLRLAAREESRVPEGYGEWKGELLAQRVDLRFKEFLGEDTPTRVRLEEVVWGGVAVDGIPALEDPVTIPASEAFYLRDDEPVFGVALNGAARAYPLRIVDWHEMVNDVVGGEAVSLAYCTLCGAGVLYRGEVGERTFRFGSSGLLMRSNKLMYDRQTRSLWNQLTGEPVIGELAESGIELEVLPSVLTTWGAWRARHPETDVLDPETGYERDYSVGGAYGSYFGSAELMFPAHREQESELADKDRIFVVRLASGSGTWPLDEIRTRGVVNERVAETPVVLVAFDGRRSHPLGEGWPVDDARDLDSNVLRALVEADEGRLEQVTAELLLAMPTAGRLAFLDWLVASEPSTRALALRDEVAQRGLTGEVRAYARGDRVLQRTAEGLRDRRGREWRIEEDALVGPDGERLERLPGHLAFAFGWEAFSER